MQVCCSWCGRDLGPKEPLGRDVATYGICAGCLGSVSREVDLMPASEGLRPSRSQLGRPEISSPTALLAKVS